MGGAQFQLRTELRIAIVLAIFCITSSKAGSKVGKVNWKGTLIIKAVVARKSNIRNYIVQCCGRSSCSTDYDGSEYGGNSNNKSHNSTNTKIDGSIRKVKGKGGVNKKKNKLNGNKPGKGKNVKNSNERRGGKGKTKNKNENSKGVGAAGGPSTKRGQDSSNSGVGLVGGSALGLGTGGSNISGGNAGPGGSGGTEVAGTEGSGTGNLGIGGVGAGGLGAGASGAGASGADDSGAGASGADASGAGATGAAGLVTGDSGAEGSGAGGAAEGAGDGSASGSGGSGTGGAEAGGSETDDGSGGTSGSNGDTATSTAGSGGFEGEGVARPGTGSSGTGIGMGTGIGASGTGSSGSGTGTEELESGKVTGTGARTGTSPGNGVKTGTSKSTRAAAGTQGPGSGTKTGTGTETGTGTKNGTGTVFVNGTKTGSGNSTKTGASGLGKGTVNVTGTSKTGTGTRTTGVAGPGIGTGTGTGITGSYAGRSVVTRSTNGAGLSGTGSSGTGTLVTADVSTSIGMARGTSGGTGSISSATGTSSSSGTGGAAGATTSSSGTGGASGATTSSSGTGGASGATTSSSGTGGASTESQKNPSLATGGSSTGNVTLTGVVPNTHGVWIEKCGRTYLLGNYLGRYDRAWDYCCGLGMTPIMFETGAEQICFGAMVNKTWPFNTNYWTAGKGIPGNYSWCGGTAEVPIVKDNLWDVAQPDFKWKNQYCVHLKLNKDTGKALLTDRNCTDWFIIACEGPPTPAPTTAKPSCPPMTCAKDLSKFEFMDKNKLKNPKDYGTWKEICGRVYLFGPLLLKKSWADTRKLCCSIGMKPFGMEALPEHSCLIRQSYFSKNIWGTYWTGGTDQQFEGQFIWCGSNKTFNDTQVVWKSGQPDNAGGNDNCVSTVVANKTITIEDTKCDALNQYICETRSSAKAPGSAMQEECAAYFSLTQPEINSILNGTSRKYNVKCFMKCMGENMEIYKDGQLIEDATFKLIEEVSEDDEVQLQKDTETYFDCKTRRGADECETAEAIFDCGRNSVNSSLTVGKILIAVETNATAEKAPVPCTQPECGGPCSPDPVKLQNLAANTVPAFEGKVKNICGKQYFFDQKPMYSWGAAKSLCCSYGMQLMALETMLEKLCVTGADGITGSFWGGGISSGCPGFGYQWCYVNEPVDYTVVMRPPFSPSLLPCFTLTLGFGSAGVVEAPCAIPSGAVCESY